MIFTLPLTTYLFKYCIDLLLCIILEHLFDNLIHIDLHYLLPCLPLKFHVYFMYWLYPQPSFDLNKILSSIISGVGGCILIWWLEWFDWENSLAKDITIKFVLKLTSRIATTFSQVKNIFWRSKEPIWRYLLNLFYSLHKFPWFCKSKIS